MSARAPFTIAAEKYAWYQVDFSSGRPVINKEQAEKSRIVIVQFLNQLKEKHVFDESEVYLCGFSQGGIMAYSVGLTRPDKIKGIAVLSGRLLEEIKPTIVSKDNLKNLQIFISHGNIDAMLKIDYAKQAYQFLINNGTKPIFKEYESGHFIIPEMLEDLNLWLNASAGNKFSIN